VADNVEFSAYSKRELASLAKTFTVMGDDAVESARKVSYEIASLAQNEIRQAGYSRDKSAKAVRRVVDGATVSRTSKTGRLSYGFAGQRFSGGATTQKLWGGLEFGSSIRPRKDGTVRRWEQFPQYSGRYGAGSRGWFIYPTLRKIQPQLTLMWMREVNKVVKGWKN
jgi:hypothetical protein